MNYDFRNSGIDETRGIVITVISTVLRPICFFNIIFFQSND